MDAVVLLGLATVALAVGFSVPQLSRLLRTGSTSGVSLPGVANSTISFAAWTGYAVDIADPWLLASSAVGVPGGVATTVLAWRRGADRRGMWLPVVWAGVLVAAYGCDTVLGSSLVGLAVGASVLWLLAPALITAWRSPDVSGIAAGSWLVLAAEGLLFLGYGLAAGVLASVLYGVVTLVGCAAMLLRIAAGPAPSRRHCSSGRIGARDWAQSDHQDSDVTNQPGVRGGPQQVARPRQPELSAA